jgi:hypothetical protein
MAVCPPDRRRQQAGNASLLLSASDVRAFGTPAAPFDCSIEEEEDGPEAKEVVAWPPAVSRRTLFRGLRDAREHDELLES